MPCTTDIQYSQTLFTKPLPSIAFWWFSFRIYFRGVGKNIDFSNGSRLHIIDAHHTDHHSSILGSFGQTFSLLHKLSRALYWLMVISMQLCYIKTLCKVHAVQTWWTNGLYTATHTEAVEHCFLIFTAHSLIHSVERKCSIDDVLLLVGLWASTRFSVVDWIKQPEVVNNHL